MARPLIKPADQDPLCDFFFHFDNQTIIYVIVIPWLVHLYVEIIHKL